jgi:2-iminobutanoate/2-iminopropanoate deaminase
MRARLAPSCLALIASLAGAAAAEPPRRVVVEGLGRLPAFSHATVAGELVFVSGTLGTKPGGLELVPGGVGPQTAQALRNVATILAAEGAGLADVAKCSVFLLDMQDFAAMNEAWLPFFAGSPPARTTIAAAGLALGARVEIECIAARPAEGAGLTPRGSRE